MQKLTVFYIGATVMVIGVLAALLGYEYAIKQKELTPEQPQATIEETEKDISDEISEEQEDDLKDAIVSERTVPENEQDEALIIENETEFPTASIDEEKAVEAGFSDVEIETGPFSGIIFSKIDLTDYRDDDHISYKFIENNENAGDITEFILPDENVTNELYASIKSKIEEVEGFEANETNQYGEQSFFANYDKDTNSVFLVVKLKSRLYTLHYPAKNHNKMKNLILTL